MSAVGFGQIEGVIRGNIIGRGIGLVAALVVGFGGRPREPVIPVQGNSKRELLRRHDFQRVIQIGNGPVPSGHRTGDSPRSVLVIGHQAEKIYRFRYRPQIISSAPVPVNPRGESRLAWIDRKSTRLNSSHVEISYAVFCLKKKKKVYKLTTREKR